MGALLKVLIRLALVLGGLYLLWRWWRGAKPRRAQPGPGGPQAPTQAPTPAQPMVACAHCGLHLPATEVLWSGTRPFCSPAHLQAGPRP